MAGVNAAGATDPLYEMFKLIRSWRADRTRRVTDEMFDEFLELWQSLYEQRERP